MPLIHTIRRRYSFEAAHFLPLVPEGHKCKRLHGHNYEFDVVVEGEVNVTGWVLDFWDLDRIVLPIVETIDHRLLNDISGLENPTAEIIAAFLLEKIGDSLHNLLPALPVDHKASVLAVSVYETKDAIATCTDPISRFALERYANQEKTDA